MRGTCRRLRPAAAKCPCPQPQSFGDNNSVGMICINEVAGYLSPLFVDEKELIDLLPFIEVLKSG
jgi:hypothetical protein